MKDFAVKQKLQGRSYPEIKELILKRYGLKVTVDSVRGKVKYELSKVDVASKKNNASNVKMLSLISGEELTDEQLLKLHGYKPSEWDLLKATSNYWGQTKDVSLYQSKIDVRPKTGLSDERLIELMNAEIKPVHIKKLKTGKHNLVIPLFDLHFGIMKYDDMKSYINGIWKIIDTGYKNIVIEIGGDTLHSNDINRSQTYNGTMLDQVDTIQAWDDAIRFLSAIVIKSLQSCEQLKIFAVGGNHDESSQWPLVESLGFKYPDIEIHNPAEYRLAYQIDKVGIMIAHGDKAKRNLPGLFANEFKQIWADTDYREIHKGHFHSEKVTDDLGVVSRQFGTPKKSDPYEIKNGFTMAYHKLQVLEFSETDLYAIYNL